MKIVEDNDSITKNYCICKKCHEYFVFMPDEAQWIECGMYSEKITKCTHCGCINIIKYQDGFNQNPNFDERYYK